jgi:hypothetical protein
MEIKTIPDNLTKKMLFELYQGLSKKIIRAIINHSIRETGGNVRVKIIPLRAKLDFFLTFPVPDGYKLSEEHQKKLIILNEIRTGKR